MKRRYTPMQWLNWRLRRVERQLADANLKLDVVARAEDMRQKASLERMIRPSKLPPRCRIW